MFSAECIVSLITMVSDRSLGQTMCKEGGGGGRRGSTFKAQGSKRNVEKKEAEWKG